MRASCASFALTNSALCSLRGGTCMIVFARTCAAIAATASKLEKVALVAAYLRGLDDADLAPAARFFTGNPLAHADQRSLGLGGRTLVAAAHIAWGVGSGGVREAYRATGDLGAA